jgi:hypothetical protein
MPVGKPQVETAHRHDGQKHGGAEYAAHVAAGFALPRCHLVFDLGRFCRHRDLSSRFVSGAHGRIALRLKHEDSDGSSREVRTTRSKNASFQLDGRPENLKGRSVADNQIGNDPHAMLKPGVPRGPPGQLRIIE